MKKDFQLQEYTLDNKLENNLFFKRMDIAVVPSYNFWFLPEAFIIRYGSLNKDFFSRVIRVIKKHHEPYDQYHINGTKRKEYYNALSLMNYVLPIV
jgi:hypothetical protein